MGSLAMEPDDIASYASSTFHPEDNFSTICMSVGKINSRGIFHDDPLNFSLPLLLIQLSLASLVILFSSRLLKYLGQPSMVPQILVSRFWIYPQSIILSFFLNNLHAFIDVCMHHIDNICVCA